MKLHACVFAFAVTVLAGCGNPYALKTTSVDRDRFYPARDAVAAIELSDPQVFAREALINDRLEQAAYLKQKLDDSKNVTFGPDLIRELTYQSALAGSLGVTVDPAAAFAARNTQALNAVRHEIERTRLETELLEEQKKNRAARGIKKQPKPPRKPLAASAEEEAPAAEESADEEAATDEAEADAGTADGGSEGSSGVSAYQKALKETLDALRDQEKATLTASVTRPQSTNVMSSPREALLDLNAYRDEIRALIAENALDDAHDIRGNSLFRLGFTATVLPGQKLDKWGLINASIEPPKWSLDDLSAMYSRWLEHATYRSNDARTSKGNRDRSYELIAAGTGAYALAKMRFRSGDDFLSIDDDDCWKAESEREAALIDCDTITLAVPPVFKALAERPFSNESDIKLAVLAKKRWAPNASEFDANKAAACSLSELLKAKSEKSVPAPASAPASVIRDLITRMYPDEFLPDERKWKRTATSSDRKYAAEEIRKIALGKTRSIQRDLEEISYWSDTSWEKYFQTLRGAQYMVAMAPLISHSAQGIFGRRDPEPRLQNAVSAMLSRYESAVQDARVVLNTARETANAPNCDALSSEKLEAWGRRQIPQPFLKAVLCSDSESTSDEEQLPCKTYSPNRKFKHSVYATRPLELAQRTSTVASAAEALELAVAVKASLANAGVGAEAGLNYSRAATGKVEALERLPLVVAYSSGSAPRGPRPEMSGAMMAPPPCTRSDEQDCKWAPDHSFGWVLGPKARVDAANQQLVLEHGVSTYPVTADVSVPAWWGSFTLNVETGWVGNWNDGRVGPILPTDVKARKIEVRTPVTRADLDALTAAVVSELAGDRVGSSRIRNVLPSENSLCGTDALTVQVYGADIWRSTLVTLDGVEASPGSIRVLPDLEGVTASFSRAALRNRSAQKGTKADLVIWTRSGHDTFEVELTGKLKGGKCIEEVAKSNTPKLSKTASTAPRDSTAKTKLTVVSPKALSFCANTASFAIQGEGLAVAEIGTTSDKKVQLNWDVRLGSVPATKTVPQGIGKARQSAIATFDKLIPLAWHALSSVPLTVVDDEGAIATADIALVSDAAACAAAVKASTIEAAPPPMPLSLKSPEKVNVCAASAELVLEGDGADSIESAILLETAAKMTLDKPSKGQLTLTFVKLPVLDANRDPPTVPLRLKAKAGAPNAAKVKPELVLPTLCEAKKP
ncbi:hypothetical protein [Nevskia sp.]|uniref:hypothetical protein n=1 Tax=Nevskia sp. TaxID=1929292 RepID=UPI0025F01873|nr:hypothetical protein [Nevskia sp.]